MQTAKQDGDIEITDINVELLLRERASAPKSTPVVRSAPIDTYRYKVGPRDVLSITVWDHPELTIPAGEFRSVEAAGHLVAEDGSIFYPEVGELSVQGKTVGEIRLQLTEALSAKIKNPQLDVRVAAFRSKRVYLTGEVIGPGLQPITDVPITVLDAINQAGGVTSDADMPNVTVSRNGESIGVNLLNIYENGDLSQNLLLLNGDVVYVPNREHQKVFVLGEVNHPSAIRMRVGGRMSLSEALVEAGSINPISASAGQIFVIRGSLQAPSVYHLDASSPDALLLGESFELKPRDVIYVETSGLARWSRVIAQILPTAQLLRQSSATDFPLLQGRGDPN